MSLGETRCECVQYMQLAMYKVQWPASVTSSMKFRVPLKKVI